MSMSPRQQTVAAACAACLMKALIATLRFRIDDRAGIGAGACAGPAIWAFWHNRMLVMPSLHQRFFKPRRGVVLTSASGDGGMVAKVVGHFGFGAVRGSSSRRGGHALLELTTAIGKGLDAGVTPDGPRGPRYRLGRGIVLLAQKTGAPIIPCHVTYGRCVQLKSWDRFMIPIPFTTVTVTLNPLEYISPTATDEEFDAERTRIEKLLGTDGSDAAA